MLLHGATGGVGLAALQVLQARGAAVAGTAGSGAKRALLRGAGVGVALSSRTHLFAEELAAVGGATALVNTLTSAGEWSGGDGVGEREMGSEMGKLGRGNGKWGYEDMG